MPRIPNSERLSRIAVLLAYNVYGEMDQFRAEHLSDAQMDELIPIIENAIYSGLHLIEYAAEGLETKESRNAGAALDSLIRTHTGSWKPSKHTEFYQKCMKANRLGRRLTEEKRQKIAELARWMLHPEEFPSQGT